MKKRVTTPDNSSLIELHRARLKAVHEGAGAVFAPIKRSLFDNRIAITTTEFAAHTGLSIRTVQRMISAHKIGFVRVGRRVLIPSSAIEAWLNQME